MTRESKAEILILKTWPFKERHRSMKALSPQLGLVDLIQFGGQSSKKGRRKGAESFCYGLAILYKEPRYDGFQLKDFQLIHSFQENRGDLKKIYIQALMAESMLISHAAGGDRLAAFNLLKNSLSMLEKAEDDQQSQQLLIYFILQFLHLMGLGEFYRMCSRCGRELESSEPLFCDPRGSHCCPHCAGREMMPLPPGARAFLSRLEKLPLDQLYRVGLPRELHVRLKEWMVALLQHHLPRQLKSLKSGAGLI